MKDKFQTIWIEKNEEILNMSYKAYLSARLMNGFGLELTTQKGL